MHTSLSIKAPVIVKPSASRTTGGIAISVIASLIFSYGAIFGHPSLFILVVPFIILAIYLILRMKKGLLAINANEITLSGVSASTEKKILIRDLYKVVHVKHFYFGNGTGISTYEAVCFITVNGNVPIFIWTGQYAHADLMAVLAAFPGEAKVEIDRSSIPGLLAWFTEQSTKKGI